MLVQTVAKPELGCRHERQRAAARLPHGAAGPLAEPAAGIAAGYAFEGPALELGALLWDGACHPDARIRVPLPVLNRHGLVAGATGTGKTKTLQLIAEQLSANGVPVFLADIKGDVSGISAPGTDGEKVRERAGQVGQEWHARGFPCAFYGLGAPVPASRSGRRSRASVRCCCPRCSSSTRRRSSRSA